MATATAQPDLSANAKPLVDIEPDEVWKTQARKRIEEGLKEMVKEAAKVRDTALATAQTETDTVRVQADWEERMNTIRNMAQTEYNRQLRTEKVERQWVMNQMLNSSQSEQVAKEQQAILDIIKREEGGNEQTTNPVSHPSVLLVNISHLTFRLTS